MNAANNITPDFAFIYNLLHGLHEDCIKVEFCLAGNPKCMYVLDGFIVFNYTETTRTATVVC